MGGTRLLVNRFLGDNSDFLEKIERKNLGKTDWLILYLHTWKISWEINWLYDLVMRRLLSRNFCERTQCIV